MDMETMRWAWLRLWRGWGISTVRPALWIQTAGTGGELILCGSSPLNWKYYSTGNINLPMERCLRSECFCEDDLSSFPHFISSLIINWVCRYYSNVCCKIPILIKSWCSILTDQRDSYYSPGVPGTKTPQEKLKMTASVAAGKTVGL